MGKVSVLIMVWCIPSLVVVAMMLWHRRKAQARVRQLGLDEIFSAREGARSQQTLNLDY